MFILALLCVVLAVERSKFRTCAQSAFCTRNRAIVETVRSKEPFATAPGAPRVDSPERLRLDLVLRKESSTAKQSPPVFGSFVRRCVWRLAQIIFFGECLLTLPITQLTLNCLTTIFYAQQFSKRIRIVTMVMAALFKYVFNRVWQVIFK